jgi:hypothetical protein
MDITINVIADVLHDLRVGMLVVSGLVLLMFLGICWLGREK